MNPIVDSHVYSYICRTQEQVDASSNMGPMPSRTQLDLNVPRSDWQQNINNLIRTQHRVVQDEFPFASELEPCAAPGNRIGATTVIQFRRLEVEVTSDEHII